MTQAFRILIKQLNGNGDLCWNIFPRLAGHCWSKDGFFLSYALDLAHL